MVLSSQFVVTPEGVRGASVVVEDSRIAAVEPYRSEGDVGPLWILPGLVDTHVHINDPGRAHWEGFDTATRAAAAGGITTVIDMPLNSIPATTSVAGLEAKRAAAAGRCFVDYGFWGGLVAGNAGEIEPLARAGVLGFKCFLAPSGVDEFPMVTEADLRTALPHIVRTGLPLLVHAESPEHLLESPGGDWREYATYLASRPDEAEVAAIRRLIELCRECRCPIHVVHLSSTKALADLRSARAEGLPITVETCPHYLQFAAEDIGVETLMKCAPPIRSRFNRECLWDALQNGDIDLIATDHSPCPPEMKAGDFQQAWGGIASLSIALPVVWTAARERGMELPVVVRWMSERPALLAGLQSRKGCIAPGFDADLVLFDPDAVFEVTPERLHYRHKVSVYKGQKVRGVVKETFLRGERVGETPSGVSLR